MTIRPVVFYELDFARIPSTYSCRTRIQPGLRIPGRPWPRFFPQLPAASAWPQKREDLLHANRSVGIRRQAVPGRAPRTDAMGSKCGSSGRGDPEEGKDEAEVSPADNF